MLDLRFYLWHNFFINLSVNPLHLAYHHRNNFLLHLLFNYCWKYSRYTFLN